MFVKICGTTNAEDAALSVELGADALGFIFAPSKRRVTPEQAAAITRDLPVHVERVGVFTEPDLDVIARTVHDAGLSAVQMHWPYEAAIVAALRQALGLSVKLWQVVGFAVDPEDVAASERAFSAQLQTVLADAHLDVLLLDAVKGSASGGLGQVLPWRRVRSLLQAAGAIGLAESRRPQVVLAGGLRAENVGEAIATLQPWGVDVVSGVEASPGTKSPDRLSMFFASVRQPERP